MTGRVRKPAVRKRLTLKDAFETEFARREMERRKREEELRRQQELDLAHAEQLFEVIVADDGFLDAKGLSADRRRYAVTLDHERFCIEAYFDGGHAAVTLTDKRASVAAASQPRKQETAGGVDDALRTIAQFLADEIR